MTIMLKYLYTLFRYGRWKLLLSVTLTLFLGAFQSLTLVIFIPILNSIGIKEVQSAFLSQLNQWIDSFSISMTSIILISAGGYFFLTLLSGFVNLWHSNLKISIQTGFTSHLMKQLFSKISSASWTFVSRYSRSDMIHYLNTELSRVSMATQQGVSMLTTIILMGIQIVLAWLISPIVTLFALVSGGIFLLLTIPMLKKSRALSTSLSQQSSVQFKELLEHFQGLKETKVYGFEHRQIHRFNHLRDEMDHTILSYQKMNSMIALVFSSGQSMLLVLFLAISLWVLNTPLQEFFLISIIFSRLWPKITSLQQNIQHLASVLPAYQNIHDLNVSLQEHTPHWAHDTTHELSFQHTLSLSKLSFAYKEKNVLNDISLTIPKGKTVAFVGRSGAGKSTLIDILLGLHQPHLGHILCDDQVVESMKGLQSMIGYVSQTPQLFNASIRYNLLWAKPEASEAELWEALRLASAYEFVKASSEGLDTIVGDQGGFFSGGERQRIVLARALLRRPQILILDEATSALDHDHEYAIRQSLKSLHGTMTIIIIAHRLTTVMECDHLYVLEEGRLIEEGTYEELIEKQGFFVKINHSVLARNQFHVETN
jgi:ATP-binding cassette, subfamily C, bacterial